MQVSNKLDGRSPNAAKALQMAFIFDVATTVLVLLHWFLFWFTNYIDMEIMG